MQELSDSYRALTDDVGFVELPSRTVIEVTGEDRATLLQNLCTADIQSLKPGQGTEAFFTNVKGKVLAHALVLCGPASIALDTAGDQGAVITPHLDRYIIREDVQLHDRSDQFAHLLISGTKSPACVSAVFGDAPAEMLDCTGDKQLGDDVLVVRSPMAAPPHFLVRVPITAKQEVTKRLEVAGAVPCGMEAFEALRIEAGFPVYGPDISESNLPQEVGRDQEAVSFTKGCYLGQETVARLDALGHVNWMLAGLRGGESARLEAGTELSVDGNVVARVGSSAFSPKYGAPLALAYVRAAHAQVGTELQTSQGNFVVEFVVGK